jgi:hypothetical protein
MQDPTGEDRQKSDSGNSPVKKPYLKPAFRYERVFVTTALSCGKMADSQLQCKSNTKAS